MTDPQYFEPPAEPYEGQAPTAKQKKAYELRRQGLSWQAVADAMGCQPGTARNHVERAVERGLPALPKRMRNGNARLDSMAGKAIAGAVTPEGMDIAKVVESMEAVGMPRAMISGLVRRLKTQYRPVVKTLEKFNADLFAEKLGLKADLIAEYMDEPLMAASGMKDLAYALSVLVDKRQILAGKPTQIYDITVRAKLDALVPALLAEARRRGITLEGEFSHVVAERAAAIPVPTDDAPGSLGEGVVHAGGVVDGVHDERRIQSGDSLREGTPGGDQMGRAGDPVAAPPAWDHPQDVAALAARD